MNFKKTNWKPFPVFLFFSIYEKYYFVNSDGLNSTLKCGAYYRLNEEGVVLGWYSFPK